ncbi:hypothetical protein CSKR_110155 [Clonorchis sinensis]|uniref:Uncharacterized protein n=1 Tax=Clonorchis sinensis TaxID=79923 RepID=A0A419Q037_CLOSI|nr:hypothetical protein CSKR_110155 [Clonorchis sinensis]
MFRQPAILAFLDFNDAFDSVDRCAINYTCPTWYAPKVCEHNSILIFAYFWAGGASQGYSYSPFFSNHVTDDIPVRWPHTRLKSTRQRLVAFVGLFGMGILFIFTPLSGERSSSCSDVVIPVSPHQSTALGSINDGINDAYPKAVRDLNSGHLICENCLNATLEDHQYTIRFSDELCSKLNGGKCFTKLDISDAYLHIVVSDGNKLLLTINSHVERKPLNDEEKTDLRKLGKAKILCITPPLPSDSVTLISTVSLDGYAETEHINGQRYSQTWLSCAFNELHLQLP